MTTSVVGVISDTHGLLRPEATHALRGSDLLIHAGDIGGPEVLVELEAIAPTYAVRGNIDTGGWAGKIPATEVVKVGDLLVYVLHEIDQLDLSPSAAGISVVVFGHSHKPSIESRGGVVYLNPGSAGPRRFHLPVAIARITVEGNIARPEIIELSV